MVQSGAFAPSWPLDHVNDSRTLARFERGLPAVIGSSASILSVQEVKPSLPLQLPPLEVASRLLMSLATFQERIWALLGDANAEDACAFSHR